MRRIATFALLGIAIGGAAIAGTVPFTLTTLSEVAAKGKRGVVSVTVKAGKGYHMNKDYPTSLKLNAPDTTVEVLKLEKLEYSKKDLRLTEAAADFEVGFTGYAAGNYAITGEVKFAVCTETTCDPKKEKVEFEIHVK